MNYNRTFSVQEAADLLGVGKATIYKAIERGEVVYSKIGRRKLLPGRWVKAMVEGTAVEGTVVEGQLGK
ncbi:MAG: helix-turn-helix domain-containing protein [Chloroflexaceae bacterium]|nr:helix-turn-helix domain-containing protein [Chloroflexaceae bacterium]